MNYLACKLIKRGIVRIRDRIPYKCKQRSVKIRQTFVVLQIVQSRYLTETALILLGQFALQSSPFSNTGLPKPREAIQSA